MKKPIVKKETVIKTYSKKYQETSTQYPHVIQFRKETGFGGTMISRCLKIKKSRVDDWIYRNHVPLPLKTVKKCEKHGWIPLFPTPELARIVGYNVGDGHIRNNLSKTFFYGKYKYMENLNHFIQNHFSIRGSINEMENGVFCLDFGNAAFTRVLHAAGCPKGSKTKQVFKVPDWIMCPQLFGCSDKESKDIQLAFLQGLNDSETTKLSLKKGYSYSIQEIRLEMCTFYISQQMHFVRQLQKLFSNFEVKTRLIKPQRRERRIKDSYRFGLRIKSDLINVLKFITYVGFYFNTTRNRETIDLCLEIVKERLKNIRKCVRAIKMRKNGRIYKIISRKLNVPIGTIHGWCSRGRKPLYFKKRKELKKFMNELKN